MSSSWIILLVAAFDIYSKLKLYFNYFALQFIIKNIVLFCKLDFLIQSWEVAVVFYQSL